MSRVRIANTNSQFYAVKRLLLILGLAVLCGTSAFGQSVIWGGGSGDWFLPPGSPTLNLPNWSCLCSPNGSTFAVTIGTASENQALSGSVGLNGSATVGDLTLGITGAYGELDVLTGNTLASTNDVIVGAGANSTGKLSIVSGGVVTDVNGALGSLAHSTGSATVNGLWENSQYVTVGVYGSGTLNIVNGIVKDTNGDIGANAESVGSAYLNGPHAVWNSSAGLIVGDAGSGSVNVSGDALLSASSVTVGATQGGSGVLNLTDGGQLTSSGAVIVGLQGAGNLTVQAGASGASGSLIVGGALNGNGTALLTNRGSTWNGQNVAVGVGTGSASLTLQDNSILAASGSITIGGRSPNATLTINTGGELNDASATVAGGINGAKGTVKVEGAGSQWTNSGNLTIGGSGAGSLTIGSGGVVGSGQSFIDGNGSVTLSDQGSQWNATSLAVGDGGTGALTLQTLAIVSAANGVSIGVSSGNGSVSIVDGSQLNTSSLCVGCSGNGTLTLEAGGAGSSSGKLDIGQQPGSVGSMSLVAGVGSWSNGGPVIVGDGGTGSIELGYEGSFSTSQSITIGMSGHGSVGLIGDLFSNLSTGPAYIAYNSGSVGEASLSGPGTFWSSAAMIVGVAGNGTLEIGAGGIVRSSQGDVALSAGSVGTVTVGGSGPGVGTPSWNVAGPLSVGDGGAGELEVNYGGLVSDTDAIIGKSAGSTGTVTIDGTASVDPAIWTNTGTLYVGSSGEGSLTISNGAFGFGASVSDTAAYVGDQLGSVGTVIVTGPGSVWSNATTVDIGVNGTGALTVSNGGQVTAGTLENPGTITIGNTGTVNADSGILQGNVINHGTLDPLGTITINGDYTQGVDGTLILDVAGTGTGEFGQLDVSGNSTFDGTIDLDFTNGFAPSQGDMFDFINVEGSADFSGATFDISGLLPGFEYSDEFANGKFTVTALNDGTSASPTPEPGTFLLMGTALLGLLSLRRRTGSICAR